MRLQNLGIIDINAGGTFHGRDVFLELAVLLANQKTTLNEVCEPYPKKDINIRLSKQKISTPFLKFEKIQTDRWISTWANNPKETFNRAYFLQIIQSPRYQHQRNKVFHVKTNTKSNSIAVINQRTGNIYIGWDGCYLQERSSGGVYIRMAEGTWNTGDEFKLKDDVTLLWSDFR